MESKVEYLLAAYDRVYEVFRLSNENLFKRTNFYMVAFEAALFVAVFNTLSKIEANDWRCVHWILVAVASSLGMAVSCLWLAINKRQNNYIEFARFRLREIEANLLALGVPLTYFLDEQSVYHRRLRITARSTGEQFPDSPARSRGRFHHLTAWFSQLVGFLIGTFKGGLRYVEQGIGLGLFTLWAVLFIISMKQIACS